MPSLCQGAHPQARKASSHPKRAPPAQYSLAGAVQSACTSTDRSTDKDIYTCFGCCQYTRQLLGPDKARPSIVFQTKCAVFPRRPGGCGWVRGIDACQNWEYVEEGEEGEGGESKWCLSLLTSRRLCATRVLSFASRAPCVNGAQGHCTGKAILFLRVWRGGFVVFFPPLGMGGFLCTLRTLRRTYGVDNGTQSA